MNDRSHHVHLEASSDNTCRAKKRRNLGGGYSDSYVLGLLAASSLQTPDGDAAFTSPHVIPKNVAGTATQRKRKLEAERIPVFPPEARDSHFQRSLLEVPLELADMMNPEDFDVIFYCTAASQFVFREKKTSKELRVDLLIGLSGEVRHGLIEGIETLCAANLCRLGFNPVKKSVRLCLQESDVVPMEAIVVDPDSSIVGLRSRLQRKDIGKAVDAVHRAVVARLCPAMIFCCRLVLENNNCSMGIFYRDFI